MIARTPFRKLLIANRGEIALRILRSAQAAGLATVAVHSDVDANALHVQEADEAVCIGGASPRDSYLRIDAILEAARRTGADAIHPGYGFLAENETFARAVRDAGLIFVGPSPEAIHAMGDKAGAKAIMTEAGVPCVPGYQGEDQSAERLEAEAARIGYPLMIKATAGGGGRGMRLVREGSEFAAALSSAKSEAMGAFGDDTVLLERAIERPRHIEIQILADRYGHAVHLGERDCSVQRRHQKLIEESPSPAVSAQLRARMGEVSVRAVQAIGYEGAGTLEFLLDASGEFYFMEMNTRLQVEHPVTEAITGLDLVAQQLLIAAGEPLALTQDSLQFSGHAIEVRLCAEDPAAGFMPQSGQMVHFAPAKGLRVDSALRSGETIPAYYDSMIGKLIAHGATRDEARRNLLHGLERTVALGIRTNVEFLARCLDHPVFAQGEATTAFIAENEADLLPELIEEEKEAAAIAAGLVRAGITGALQHRFPAPLRLACAGREHELVVQLDRSGEVSVEGEEVSITLRPEAQMPDARGPEARGPDATRRFDIGNRTASAQLIRHGTAILLHWQGRNWIFEDLTWQPKSSGTGGAADGRVRASMNGRVVSVLIAPDSQVQAGDPLVVLEAMKMEHTHTATMSGRVTALHVAEGDQVEAYRVMVEIGE